MQNMIAFVAAVAYAVASCGGVIAQAQKQYATPTAVFDAYRVAVAKKDAATKMYCHIKEIREDAYQALVAGEYAVAVNAQASPGIAAVLKKFGADRIHDEYLKRFKAKYGFDPDKASEAYEAKIEKAMEDYRKAHPNAAPGSSEETDAAHRVVGPPPKDGDDELF